MSVYQALLSVGINPFAATLLLESILNAEQKSEKNRQALKDGFLFPFKVRRNGEDAIYQVLIVREEVEQCNACGVSIKSGRELSNDHCDSCQEMRDHPDNQL